MVAVVVAAAAGVVVAASGFGGGGSGSGSGGGRGGDEGDGKNSQLEALWSGVRLETRSLKLTVAGPGITPAQKPTIRKQNNNERTDVARQIRVKGCLNEVAKD